MPFLPDQPAPELYPDTWLKSLEAASRGWWIGSVTDTPRGHISVLYCFDDGSSRTVRLQAGRYTREDLTSIGYALHAESRRHPAGGQPEFAIGG